MEVSTLLSKVQRGISGKRQTTEYIRYQRARRRTAEPITSEASQLSALFLGRSCFTGRSGVTFKYKPYFGRQ